MEANPAQGDLQGNAQLIEAFEQQANGFSANSSRLAISGTF